MADLWKVLGYDEEALKIAKVLQAGVDLCVIEGPPGVGKSRLAEDIGGLWESCGGSTILATGDSLKGNASFHRSVSRWVDSPVDGVRWGRQ